MANSLYSRRCESLDGCITSDDATLPSWDQEMRRAALLSPREIEVFYLLGSGYSNRAIAKKLRITERTAKAHVARIMAKLQVESRLKAGLVSYAFQLDAQRN